MLVRAGARSAPVDDSPGVLTVRRRGAAGIELDLVDELGMNHAGTDEQVVEQRNRRSIQQEAGGGGAGPADDRERQQRDHRSDARQRLDDAKGIAERTGNLLQFGSAERDPRNLLAVLLADDDDLVRVIAIALYEIGDRDLLGCRQCLLLQKEVMARRVHGHAGDARR